MGFHEFYRRSANFIISDFSNNMKSELNQMINSFITSKSLKNLKISSVNDPWYPLDYGIDFRNCCDDDLAISANKLNEIIEYYSTCFKPLFSELNTTIERIEFDCMGLLNINTCSNLLNNKSIKIGRLELHSEPISINQYLFENIFTSPLTSIRHYRIKFDESIQFKFIFNLILNNIFKLQLYSLIFEIYDSHLVDNFVKEFKNLINNIPIQQQQQLQEQQQQEQQQEQNSNNINLKEIRININIKIMAMLNNKYDEYKIFNN
ncbi:hypothetical protein ACTFIY_008777 [Dictyostelium cf. discoideum]